MKILLDDGFATATELTGIGVQCLGLFGHLSRRTQVSLMQYSPIKRFPKILRRGIYIVVSNFIKLFSSFDLIHYINFYVPLFHSSSVTVVTIHDLSVFTFLDALPAPYTNFMQKNITLSLRRADLIIVPSHSIKNEILSLFPFVKESQIEVCFNGLRKIFFENNLEQVNHQKDKYYLFVGTLEKRKRVDFLVDAFREAKAKNALNRDTMLYLVGKQGYGFEDIERRLPADGSVKIFGYVPDKELVQLYRSARAFIFPSQYEGFGIPLLEAMSSGLPILCSDIPTNRELNERHNAQMFFFSLESIKTLVKLFSEMESEHYQIRKKIDYGDLSMYDFDKVASRHWEVYEKAVFLKNCW